MFGIIIFIKLEFLLRAIRRRYNIEMNKMYNFNGTKFGKRYININLNII